ncbi:hypothetical protein L596_008919 [Steinernema carpocapsae]|uniref:Uncharacterized protein n=1 Tax=Steinernema carpocapsae TaxID=34508 RepID=A0A4U5PE18_STECR|nr:hypothetical protein L596_008919 [Steinernema carpocapsae]
MRLRITLCLLVLLPVALSQGTNTCQDWNEALLKVVKAVVDFTDSNLKAACDVPSEKLILQYMINTLKVLSLKLQKPCIFTFQPLPFNSNCAPLNTANVQFYDFLVYYFSTNDILTSMCAQGCKVDKEAIELIEHRVIKLQDILNNLP